MSKVIQLCDCAGWDNDRWLAARAHGPNGDIPYTLGGSDISTIFGLNPWTTPLELWLIKKGRLRTPKKDNQMQLQMGHLLEPVAAFIWTQKTGRRIVNDQHMYQNSDHPYILCNCDRIILDDNGNYDGILECKTTSFHKASDWANGNYPIYYELQLRTYMATLELQHGAFACMWGNNPDNDFAMPTLERDPEWENLIFETTDRWIWSLEHDIEPKEGMDRVKASKPLLALAAYKRIYGEDPIPETITLPYDESLEEKARQYKKLVEEKKALAAQVKDKETQLLSVEASMTEALRGYQRGVMETPDDKLVISVKETQRRVFDKTELENYLNATGVKNPEGEAFDLGKDFYTSRSSYSLKFGFESDTPKRKRKSV